MIRKLLICLALLLFDMTAIAPVSADMPKPGVGLEYGKILEGEYPTMARFADTGFDCYGHARTDSTLQDIHAEEAGLHSFTVKAGDRADFVLEGSYLSPMSPRDETLISWSPAGQLWSGYALEVPGDGIYLLERESKAYRMEVTDFGFDTNLSDLDMHVVMTMNMKAHKLWDADQIPAGDDDLWRTLYDSYTDDMEFTDQLSISAEGSAHLAMIELSYVGLYLRDDLMAKTDSVGFQFILNDDAEWTFALNGKAFEPEHIHFNYKTVTEEDPDPQALADNSCFVYNTMTLVLVDSDLVDRETTDVDEYEKWAEEDLKKREERNAEKNEKETSEPAEAAEPAETPAETVKKEEKKGFSLLPVIAVLIIAGGAVLYLKSSKKK